MTQHNDKQSPSESAPADPTTKTAAAAESAEAPPPPTIEEELEACRKEAAENYERFLRAKADIENILKRHQREMAERSRYDGESLAREVLASVDDLERALAHADEGGAGVSGGVELVLKGLMAALKRNGVEKIEAEGVPFDPAEHEAVTMVETEAAPAGTVISVFRSGYRMRERLLRAAMVSVSKAPEKSEGSETA